MDRSELAARLRVLCGSKTARVMEVVDSYTATPSPGPAAARYRRGSIIRQAVPHPEHPRGARRWRVWAVEENDYLVQALFSDSNPMVARWDTALCEEATELERQDDEIGRIGPRPEGRHQQ